MSLSEQRSPGARLVVTGCMAERYGDELGEAMPEADLVGASVSRGDRPQAWRGAAPAVPTFDLLNLARPPA